MFFFFYFLKNEVYMSLVIMFSIYKILIFPAKVLEGSFIFDASSVISHSILFIIYLFN